MRNVFYGIAFALVSAITAVAGGVSVNAIDGNRQDRIINDLVSNINAIADSPVISGTINATALSATSISGTTVRAGSVVVVGATGTATGSLAIVKTGVGATTNSLVIINGASTNIVKENI
jgi:hypothetical protein